MKQLFTKAVDFIISIESKKLVLGYIFVICALFLYSFTQVDLSLTLSQVSIWQVFQKYFQQIGYFNRPLSTVLFLGVVFLLFTFYLLFLRLASQRKISKKTAWTIIALTTVILTFSYNAFSYDLFNYIFDAKIITYYSQDPYVHKALDFPGDPMLSFMRWTHRTYPYGPIWLVLTVPLSILGFQVFLPTQILFKLLMALSFLGSAFFIGRIMRKVNPDYELISIVFFALNPLILIESLVSAHNDIVMVFFSLWGLYMMIQKKYARSFLLFLISVGIKFATSFLFPAYILITVLQERGKRINIEFVGLIFIFLMTFGVIAASLRSTFQPWYLLYILPYGAFSARRIYVLLPTIFLSLFALFQYVPFLYLGNWDPPVPSILFNLLVSSVIISMVAIFIAYLRFSARKK